MKKGFKKFNLLIIMTMILTLMMSSTGYAKKIPNDIKVIVNNKTVKSKLMAYEKNGEVMIPLKKIVKELGATTKSVNKAKTEWVYFNGMQVEVTAGKKEAYVHRDNDFSGIPQTIVLNSQIERVKGKVFVPAISFFEGLGMTVNWNSSKRTLSISNNSPQESEVPYTIIEEKDIKNNKKVASWYKQNYQKSGIHSYKHAGALYVLVGLGEKLTGGYTVAINNITHVSKSTAYVSAYFTAPAPDMMVTQIVTYPHILLRIDGHKPIVRLSGDIQEKVISEIPGILTYEEITVEDIKGNETISKWYEQHKKNHGISYMKDGNYMYALIGAGERPTGGFTITINEVSYISADTVSIHATVTPPGPNVRVIMMLTYPSILIRFQSDTVKTVKGEVTYFDPYDKKDLGYMDTETVSKMELYNLEGIKLRDITGNEMITIIESYNLSAIDPSFYIEMITGNTLKVTMKDATIITFTSYGSENNVIAKVDKNGTYSTHHLVAPVIAKTLLAK